MKITLTINGQSLIRDVTPRTSLADFVRVLNSADVREKMKAIGQALAPSTPEEFAAQIRTDFERWGKVVRQSGAKAD